MVLRALSLFLGALSAEGFDVARRRTLHVAQRPLEFRLAAARRLAPLRSQYDEYDEALDEVEAASARLAKAKARLAKAARSAPRPRPIGARSLLDRSDAGTLLLTVPAAGMTSGTLMGVGTYLKEQNPDVKILAVEPPIGEQVEGLRNLDEGYIPPVYEKWGGPDLLDGKRIVRPRESLGWTRTLSEIGIFSGISAGAALAGAIRTADKIDERVRCVRLLLDAGAQVIDLRLPSRKQYAEDEQVIIEHVTVLEYTLERFQERPTRECPAIVALLLQSIEKEKAKEDKSTCGTPKMSLHLLLRRRMAIQVKTNSGKDLQDKDNRGNRRHRNRGH